MSLEKKEAEDVEICNTKGDAGISDPTSQRDLWLDRCFACGQWIGEHLHACGKCLSKLSRPYHVLRKKIHELKNRSVSKGPDQNPDATTQSEPTSNAKRTTVQELTNGDRHGVMTIKIHASAISSYELKKYLDRHYPNQYKVQLRMDVFTVTVDHNKQLPEPISKVPWYLKATRR
ncbi:hypothetical protein F4818DRAFT_442041 [Hypoxylon cercidicola]|nr:hypothetical protein F4818DRAFT_442041 [Hypoxylon cercidicola]